MRPIIFSLFEEHPTYEYLIKNFDFEKGEIIIRQFPDGESYIQIKSDVQNRNIIILNSLDNPNEKILPLIFTANLAKDLGARTIGICAPYLSYMRQDKVFHDGEAVTSKYFSKIISENFDWLITVDPHLHRYKKLSEIYSIPAISLHTKDLISKWIFNNIDNPVLIGPDSESRQWVKAIADIHNIPYTVLEKNRRGDYDVSVSKLNIEKYVDLRPVLVDDIISTGMTMIETIKNLNSLNMQEPVCIGVHAVFADDAYAKLKDEKVSEIITCNSIPHISNKIDLSSILGEEIQRQLINFTNE